MFWTESSANESVASPRSCAGLAYYQAEYGPGVLAPRGWHCLGVYGSGGESLFVTPLPIEPKSNTKGPIVRVVMRDGRTSGRFNVADMIDRVFPAFRAFAARVEAEIGDTEEHRAGPNPTDLLVYRSRRVVEYKTPAQTEGIGTGWWVERGDRPIEGVAILAGSPPSLFLFAVRLPEDLTRLTPTIIREAERAGKRFHD